MKIKQKIEKLKKVDLLEKEILEKIEAAYREGLRTGNEEKDIMPFLITSQVRAYEIYISRRFPNKNPG